jgi:antitoxin component YwqK of YwqJK toxin-antitoxin module
MKSLRIILIAFFFFSINACTPKKEKDPLTTLKVKTAPDTLHGNNSMHGDVFSSLHDNGVKKMEGKIIDGKREGYWSAWYPNGVLWSECSYKGGQKHGKSIVYYENGQKRYEGNYESDKKIGTWIYYNPDGSIATKEDN